MANPKKTKFSKKIMMFLLALSAALFLIPLQSTNAVVNLVNVENNAMNFGQPFSVTGTDKAVGTVYLYKNVLTKDGITVNAKVTIESKSANATMGTVDNNYSNPSDSEKQKRFNPTINNSISGGGSYDFRVDFVDQENQPVLLKNFYVTVIDIDGDSSTNKEYVEVSGFESYTVNSPTGLTITSPGNGNTKFAGINTNLDDVLFDNSAAFIANYTAPISTMKLTLGVTYKAGSARQFSINFGAAGGVFTTPATTLNPSAPTIDVELGDGGDGILSPLDDNLNAIAVTGSTTGVQAGQTVNIVVTDSNNTATLYSGVVDADGNYSATVNLSNASYGTVTVTASVLNQYGNPASDTDTSNKPAPNTVTFNSNGGSAVPSIQAYPGTKITAPAVPVKDDVVFGGWYKEAGLTNEWDFDTDTMPASNIILYAKWTVPTYTVTFEDWNGTVLKSETVQHGANATAPADPVRTGYTFTGWDVPFVNVTSNFEVTAQYTINQYTVSFDSDGGSDVDEIQANYGAKITAPEAPTREGYDFGGWYKEAGLTNEWDFATDTVPANDIELHAKWTIKTYTVTFEDWDGEELKSETVNHGDDATAPANPVRTGYTFTVWNKAFNTVTSDLTVTAQYTINQYTVSFDSDEGSQVDDIQADYGAKITAPEEPTKEGYDFGGWYKEAGLTNEWDFTTDTVPANDVELHAKWTIKTYTVTFEDWDGEELKSETVNHGDDATAPAAPTRTGYTFTGWDVSFENVTSTLTVTAEYTLNQYTVSFDSDGGSDVDEIQANYGVKITAPEAPTREGYNFGGWYKEAALTNEWDFATDTVPANDIELHAKWTIKTYTVTFEDWNETVLKSETVDHGANATAPTEPTREGYTFQQWSTSFTNITANTTVIAEYTLNQYTVSFDSDGGSDVDEIQADYGAKITAPEEPTKEGYDFGGWFKDSELEEEWDFDSDTIPASPIELHAKWTIKTYTVTFEDWDGEELKTETVNHGDNATAPANPVRTGYTFTGWDVSFENVTSTLTVTAQYTLNQYTVSFDSDGGSEVDEIQADYGAKITAPEAPTKEGYDFGGWYKDSELEEEWDFDSDTIPASPIELHAKWTIKTYTVTFEDWDGEELKTETVNHGDNATAPANPVRTGYTFTGWDVSFENVTSTLTVTAQYTLNQYTVSFDSDGGSEVDEIQADYGAKITAPEAPTKEGYDFGGWYKDSELEEAWDFDSDTIPASPIELHAKWTIKTYTVTFEDWDGEELKSETVNHGDDATAPAAPTRIGYTFSEWDTAFVNVTSNLTVTALYDAHILDGWVGTRTRTSADPAPIFAPGDAVKLSVSASLIADQVTVTPLSGANPVTLVKTGEANGYSLWETVSYRLPDGTATGQYQLAVQSYHDGNLLPAEQTDYLANNNYYVLRTIDLVGTVVEDIVDGDDLPLSGAKVTLYDPTGLNKAFETVTDNDGDYQFEAIPTKRYLVIVEKQGYTAQKRVIHALPSSPGQTQVRADFKLVNFGLELTASPSSIVGDGQTTSMLKVVVTDRDGLPIPGVEVHFDALLGSFPDGKTSVTNASGVATVVLQSVQIEGIISQVIPVTATVNDSSKGLYDTAEILITFEPASIVGQVWNTNTAKGQTSSKAMAGVAVKLTADFDGDGIIDFAAETVTDANGRYDIAVPRGNFVYEIEVIKPVQFGTTTIEVPFKQKVEVGAVTGMGEEYTSTEKVTGVIGTENPDGSAKQLTGALASKFKAYVLDENGDIVGAAGAVLDNNGVFSVEGVTPGESYRLQLVYMAVDDQGNAVEIAVNGIPTQDGDGNTTYIYPELTVNGNGELNIAEELIDPYGVVTNANTGLPIEDAEVTLYYAGTPRNGMNAYAAGGPMAGSAKPARTGGDTVQLPILAGFPPNNNASPVQMTDDGGNYAYMVYPEADYYLVVSKPGYYTYTSPTISVEWDIVSHDVKLVPLPVYTGPTEPNQSVDVAINMKLDKNKYEEGSQAPVHIVYVNDSDSQTATGQVRVILPDGVTVADAAGGVVSGNEIVWQVSGLKPGQTVRRTIVVQLPEIGKAEQQMEIEGLFELQNRKVDAATAKATVKLMVFSNRYGAVEHVRYILGYPDGLFKPEANLTRAQLAAIMARLINGGSTGKKAKYPDVPGDHWASGYISIVTEHKIFAGYPDGSFRPEEPVTREQVASVMINFLNIQAPRPIETQFADAQGRWSTNAIEALFRNGMLSGYEDGTFKPENEITRLEAVTLINRLLFRGPLTKVPASFPDVPTDNWGFGQVEEATRSHVATRNEDGSEVFVRHLDDQVQ